MYVHTVAGRMKTGESTGGSAAASAASSPHVATAAVGKAFPGSKPPLNRAVEHLQPSRASQHNTILAVSNPSLSRAGSSVGTEEEARDAQHQPLPAKQNTGSAEPAQDPEALLSVELKCPNTLNPKPGKGEPSTGVSPAEELSEVKPCLALARHAVSLSASATDPTTDESLGEDICDILTGGAGGEGESREAVPTTGVGMRWSSATTREGGAGGGEGAGREADWAAEGEEDGWVAGETHHRLVLMVGETLGRITKGVCLNPKP